MRKAHELGPLCDAKSLVSVLHGIILIVDM